MGPNQGLKYGPQTQFSPHWKTLRFFKFPQPQFLTKSIIATKPRPQFKTRDQIISFIKRKTITCLDKLLCKHFQEKKNKLASPLCSNQLTINSFVEALFIQLLQKVINKLNQLTGEVNSFFLLIWVGDKLTKLAFVEE